MKTINVLIRARTTRLLGRVSQIGLALLGVSIPASVRIGPGLKLPHGSVGLVVHQDTVIANNVTLYQNVTLGRSDIHLPRHQLRPGGRIEIDDDVIIGAGAVILFKSGSVLRIGPAAVIGANAVVTRDIPAGEIWSGNPAKRKSVRPTS